jgi:hypothetical protein
MAVRVAALLADDLDDLLADLGGDHVPHVTALPAQRFDVGADRRRWHRTMI